MVADPNKIVRSLSQVIGGALNEIFWMLRSPGMIRCHMIRDKIQDQSHAPVGQLLSGMSQSFRTTQLRVHAVLTHAIGRANIVPGGKIRKRTAEMSQESVIAHGDGDASRTALPDAHQPDRIETVGR